MIARHEDNLIFERRVYVAETTICRLFHCKNECNVVESLYIAYTSLGLWQKNCVDNINVARCHYYPVLSAVLGRETQVPEWDVRVDGQTGIKQILPDSYTQSGRNACCLPALLMAWNVLVLLSWLLMLASAFSGLSA